MKLKLQVCLLIVLTVVSYSNAKNQVGSLSLVKNVKISGFEGTFTNKNITQKRRKDYVDRTVNCDWGGVYAEAVRLKRGVKPNEETIRGPLRGLNARPDCADFNLPAILNIFYRYSDSGLLSKSLVAEGKKAILNFKYWPDELADWKWKKTPQMDSKYIFELLNDDDPLNDSEALSHQAAFDKVDEMDDMCYWSENHYILFSSGGYLAGQLYPEEIFTASGQTGAEKMKKFRPRVMKWLELRYRSGFSEWLSNVYYNEDMPALLGLIDLCQDQEIVALATMVLDLMMADMALNSFHGLFSSTHGRTYENKMSGHSDHTKGISNLMFGMNQMEIGNMSASLLAISEKYRLPRVIYEIANDTERDEFINKQRVGITIDENTMSRWGIDTRCVEKGGNIENGMTLLTLEAYAHPRTIELFRNMLDQYCWWGNKFFAGVKEKRIVIEHPEFFDKISGTSTGVRTLVDFAELREKEMTRNTRTEVNIYTYRTPDYMLSTAQDYKAGYGGDQQSIWQATLGPEAVCFTTHPGRKDGETPNYWTGYGTLPRAIQVKNVVISLYDIDTTTELYKKDEHLFTHAYFPKGKFDKIARETVSNGVWFFGRKDNALIALFSSDKAADWKNNADDSKKSGPYEIIANGKKTIWICELARIGKDYQNISSFKKAILNTALKADALSLTVSYRSPSQGMLTMDWDNALTLNGKPVKVNDYKRYDNPYTKSDFPADKITFKFNGSLLSLDFKNKTRKVINSREN